MNNSTKYTATRCDSPTGEDMESRYFAIKALAVKWCKGARFGKVRLQRGNRPIVFDSTATN